MQASALSKLRFAAALLLVFILCALFSGAQPAGMAAGSETAVPDAGPAPAAAPPRQQADPAAQLPGVQAYGRAAVLLEDTGGIPVPLKTAYSTPQCNAEQL